MRGLLFALLLLAGVSAAHAQDARDIAVDRFGPIQFGATITQARSQLPGGWDWAGSAPDVQAVNAGPITFANQRFNASLRFRDNALEAVTLVRFEPTADPAVCRQRLNALIAIVESEIAPLTGGRTALEMGQQTDSASTPGGSAIRIYRYAPAQAELSVASLFAALDIRAWAYHGRFVMRQPGRRDIRCSLYLSIAPPADTTPPPAPPTQAEFDAVERTEPPPFTVRPDKDLFARFYPFMAYASGIDGEATLDCLVGEGGTLRCVALSSAPETLGFDEGALRLSRVLRVATEENGVSTLGRRFGTRIPFRMDLWPGVR